MEDAEEDVRFTHEFMEDVKEKKETSLFIYSFFGYIFHESLGKTYVFLCVFHEFPMQTHIGSLGRSASSKITPKSLSSRGRRKFSHRLGVEQHERHEIAHRLVVEQR